MVVVELHVPTEHLDYVLEDLCNVERVGNDEVGLQQIRSIIN
jgi:hypothetical protein